jgi:hypothetical protein
MEDIKGWTLMRAAVIAIDNPPKLDVGLSIEYENAELRTLRPVTQDGAPVGVLVICSVPLDGPPTITDQGLEVPHPERKEAEGLIEMAARYLALEYRTSHTIASPSPCLGFLAPGADLSRYEGKEVVISGLNIRSEHMWPTGLLSGAAGGSDQSSLVVDRWDGVEMLTEALNSASPLGRFTQLWRFFERAFHCGHAEASERLKEFLVANTRHDFEAAEIDDWTRERSRAIHADRPGRRALDSDVQPFMIRMLEAAYDVLLNKEEWFSKSTARRSAWKPKAGSSTPDGRGAFIMQGAAGGSFRAQLLDYFGAYPVLLGADQSVLPRAAWLVHEDRSVRVALCGGEAQPAVGAP